VEVTHRSWPLKSALVAALFAPLAAAPAAAEDELPPGHPPISGGSGGSAGSADAAKASPRGVSLPGDIRLHGRFDIAYERHGYSDAIGDGKDAFRNHHRLLFVERHAKGDPFFFNAEVLGFNFMEIGARFQGEGEDIWRASVTAGKVLVPFGADPLFHHAYGGRAGADQRVVPIIWAEYGVKGALELDLDPVALKLDAYALRGYALRAADGIVDLQTSGAPMDDLNFVGGGRLGASWGPATLYYSFQGGTLDHARSLFLQALDLTIWRPDIDVLRDFALTAGVMRTDVWGGDAEAYYHFADYIQLRWYPTDCLYVQYRAGLDTRDNRDGVWVDAARLDKKDTSAHSVSVGWLYGNFSLVVQHLWQLELYDEQDDDFLRVTATYEF